jgi:hypothetical protein
MRIEGGPSQILWMGEMKSNGKESESDSSMRWHGRDGMEDLNISHEFKTDFLHLTKFTIHKRHVIVV